LWAFDEHRIGLLPIVRKVWAKRGSHPVRIVETRYQWLYLYGFVHPQSGRTHCLILPRMNAALYNQALKDFAQAVGAGARTQIILVVDGAGSHRSQELVVPEGLHLLTLPPYSPELQPAEKLWPLTNEPLVNKRFETLADFRDPPRDPAAREALLRQALEAYVHRLEQLCREAPYNWFNFYDYWHEDPVQPAP